MSYLSLKTVPNMITIWSWLSHSRCDVIAGRQNFIWHDDELEDVNMILSVITYYCTKGTQVSIVDLL